MRQIAFSIRGNQENPDGNPIPYERSTQRGQWMPRVKRYREWQNYVRKIFSEAAERGPIAEYFDEKPIPKTKQKITMDITIFWANDAHGDSDNIWKGIADALFENDKYVSGSFEFFQSGEKKGIVYVTISFF